MADGHWHAECERLCQKCAITYAKEGDECGLCKQSYDGEFVACEKCESWHCLPCTNFTEEQIKNISDQVYFCKRCNKGDTL